jgi:hypothetical protein
MMHVMIDDPASSGQEARHFTWTIGTGCCIHPQAPSQIISCGCIVVPSTWSAVCAVQTEKVASPGFVTIPSVCIAIIAARGRMSPPRGEPSTDAA